MTNNIEKSFCYIYTVYWAETKFEVIKGQWKQQDFFIKKTAQRFAKSKKREFRDLPVKPYILKSVGFKDPTKSNKEIESVYNYNDWNKYFLSADSKRIKY